MGNSQQPLDLAHQDALDLQEKIKLELADDRACTGDDLKTVQGLATELATRIRMIAVDQAQVMKQRMDAAVTELETASHQLYERASASAEDMKEARIALMGGVRSAAHSLGQAASALRGTSADDAAPPDSEPPAS